MGGRQAGRLGFPSQHHLAQVLWLEASCLTSLSLPFPFREIAVIISTSEDYSFIHSHVHASKMFLECLLSASLCLGMGHRMRRPHVTLTLMELTVWSERQDIYLTTDKWSKMGPVL